MKKNSTIEKTFANAVKNHKNNNFKVAKKLYKKVLKINSNHVNSIYLLGSLLAQVKNFNEAKQLLQKAIQIKPNHVSAHNNLGSVLKELGEFQQAISYYQKAIMINSNNVDAHYNLGIVFKELKEFQKAINCYQKAIEIQPNHAAAHNNLGVVFRELKEFQKAISCYQKAIEIQPNHAAAHNNLGIVFRLLDKYQQAINCYKKAIEIDPNYSGAHNNLGNILKSRGKYNEAIKSYKKSNLIDSKASILECIYFLNRLADYRKMLKKFSKKDPHVLRVAAISAYVSKKENIKNIYPFCKDPLNFVFIKNLKNELTSSDEFSENLLKILEKEQSIWEPSATTTKGGYQTLSNLFGGTDIEILKLKEIIEKQINIYKKKYKSSKDHFITKWPPKRTITAWYVKLFKKGHQKSHIHPAGWLSGVFYVKVPKTTTNHEGSIKLTLYGYDYPEDKNLPNLIHLPRDFDLILFPSSLFHQTIPFSSNDERHVVAFDLMPT